jgi:hypothetical protein
VSREGLDHHPLRRGAALETSGSQIWKRFIASAAERTCSAAAPDWRGAFEHFCRPNVSNASWVPGRRVYPSAEAATIIGVDVRESLQRGMQRPSVWAMNTDLDPFAA